MSNQPTQQEKNSEEKITINRSTIWKITAFVFGVLFLIVLILLLTKGGNNTPTTITPNITGEDHILGNTESNISIIEFSDFECPYCEDAFMGALATFKQSDYFKNGEVNLIYKHYPLSSVHPHAQKAAEASECAGLQGKFWEYHDTLFTNQNALSITDLKQYANNLGLDTAAFNSCLDNGDTRSIITRDITQGVELGAEGTPYFVIVNHETNKALTIAGAYPWEQFENVIKILQE